MSPTKPTIRVAPAIALARQLEGRQIDFEIIARSVQFPTHVLRDPMQTVELRKMAQLFVAVARAVDDCGFAIKLAEESEVGNTGLLGHLTMAAPTVRSFLECLAGYVSILVTGVEAGFDEKNGTGKMLWRAPADLDATIKPLWLYIAASLVYRVRSAGGSGWVSGPPDVKGHSYRPIAIGQQFRPDQSGSERRLPSIWTRFAANLAAMRCLPPKMSGFPDP